MYYEPDKSEKCDVDCWLRTKWHQCCFGIFESVVTIEKILQTQRDRKRILVNMYKEIQSRLKEQIPVRILDAGGSLATSSCDGPKCMSCIITMMLGNYQATERWNRRIYFWTTDFENLTLIKKNWVIILNLIVISSRF